MNNPNPHFPDVDDWTPSSGALAPEGHNRPPVDEMARADFDEALLKDRPQFLEKLAQLEGSAERAEVTDDTTLGRAGDLINSLRDCQKHVDATHKDVKAPYLEAGRAVDKKKNDLAGRINDARAKVQRKGDAFVAEREAKLRAERQKAEAEARRQAEEAAAAEALRAEAAETNDAESMDDVPVIAAPTPTVPDREPVRSDAGSTVSGKKVWKSEVTDYAKAFAAVSDNDKVREAIDKAVAGLVRAGKREIDGARIWPETQMSAR